MSPSGFDFKLKKFVDATCSSHIDVLKNHWNEAFDGVPAAGGYRVILTNYGSSNVVWTCYAYQNKLYGYALCFSHPNNDVSSPQFYTISNGTWSDRNEITTKNDFKELIKCGTFESTGNSLIANAGDAYRLITAPPTGYSILARMFPTVDDSNLNVYNFYTLNGITRVCIKNQSNTEITNFTIKMDVLFIKSEYQ